MGGSAIPYLGYVVDKLQLKQTCVSVALAKASEVGKDQFQL